MQDMNRMFEQELRKVREYPQFTFYSFAYNSEIEAVRKRLKLSKVEFRTKPVIENNNVIGYKVYIRA